MELATQIISCIAAILGLAAIIIQFIAKKSDSNRANPNDQINIASEQVVANCSVSTTTYNTFDNRHYYNNNNRVQNHDSSGDTFALIIITIIIATAIYMMFRNLLLLVVSVICLIWVVIFFWGAYRKLLAGKELVFGVLAIAEGLLLPFFYRIFIWNKFWPPINNNTVLSFKNLSDAIVFIFKNMDYTFLCLYELVLIISISVSLVCIILVTVKAIFKNSQYVCKKVACVMYFLPSITALLIAIMAYTNPNFI